MANATPKGFHKRLREAILSAFPSTGELEVFVADAFGENLEAIAQGKNLKQTIYQFVRWVEVQGRLEDLMLALREDVETNLKVAAICEIFFSDPDTLLREAAKPGSDLAQISAFSQTIDLRGATIYGGVAGCDYSGNVTHDRSSNTKQEKSGEQRDRIQNLLLKQVDNEVRDRLRNSLHERIYIVLDKQKDPQYVERPWEVDVKVGRSPSERLPRETPIPAVFDCEDIRGRLLILGVPGSGKTTMLLKLTRTLVKQAQEDTDRLIPVLLNLSSWKEDQQPISKWLVEALKEKYGVRKDIGQKWLEERVLLPLLDGLDEIVAERQEICVRKLNEFLKVWKHPCVVCSRWEEYELYATKLQLNGSITLQPLRNEQIRKYVLTYVPSTQGEILWQKVRNDPAFVGEEGLARSPLFLSVLVFSYEEFSFDRWRQLKSPEERRQYLFDAYVCRMLKRPYQWKKSYEDEDTQQWLMVLARKLMERNQTEFLIEKMQPDWLEERADRLIYRLISGMIFGLITGLISGIISEPIVGLILGIIFGLIAMTSELNGMIKTTESIKFPCEDIIIGLIVGISLGLILELILKMIPRLNIDPGSGLIIGIGFSFVAGLRGAEIETKVKPNQGIWQSLKNAIFFIFIFCPLCILIFTVLQWPIEQPFELLFLLLKGLTLAILVGFFAVSEALMHFPLRLILYFNRKIPWNYARFLDYATNRLFLQRVGGRYRFVHDLLRQHFAGIKA